MSHDDLIERAKAFIAAVAARAPIEVIESFYAPDIVQQEFPNRLIPNGVTHDLAALRDADAKGRLVFYREPMKS